MLRASQIIDLGQANYGLMLCRTLSGTADGWGYQQRD